MGTITNYCFSGEDNAADIAELLERIKDIRVDDAPVFEVREEPPEVFKIFPINPPYSYPGDLFTYEGGVYKDSKTAIRQSVGEARDEYIHLGKELGALEEKIRREMYPVALVIRGSFELEHAEDAEVLRFHKLLEERLGGWLEQKVGERRAYKCGI